MRLLRKKVFYWKAVVENNLCLLEEEKWKCDLDGTTVAEKNYWKSLGLSGFSYLCFPDTHTLWTDNQEVVELIGICFENKDESFLLGGHIS